MAGPALEILLLGLGLGSNMDFCGEFGPEPRKQRSEGPERRVQEGGCRAPGCQKCCVWELDMQRASHDLFPDMPGIAPS